MTHLVIRVYLQAKDALGLDPETAAFIAGRAGDGRGGYCVFPSSSNASTLKDPEPVEA